MSCDVFALFAQCNEPARLASAWCSSLSLTLYLLVDISYSHSLCGELNSFLRYERYTQSCMPLHISDGWIMPDIGAFSSRLRTYP